jgi:2-polyprenyl-3-methyl-5-hydroxy-6-metoxy-1,4-benzoquinol methylase
LLRYEKEMTENKKCDIKEEVNMANRVAQSQGAITGVEKARDYAEKHKKYAKLMYGDLLKTIKALDISGRCLDVGAGPGLLAIMIAKEHPDITVTAIDLSPDMAAVASDYIRESGLEDKVSYVVGDVGDERLMGKLGKFDLVYSTFSLHHWKSPEKSIRNLWKAVADNGKLYLYDFRRIGWLCSLPLKMNEMRSMKASFTPDEVSSMLERTGVTDYSIKVPFPFLFQSIVARR